MLLHHFLESLIADSLVLDADTLFLTQVAFHSGWLCVSDGYGFWYNLLDNKIGMSLTTSKSANVDNVKFFSESIVKSLNDLADFAEK